MSFDVFVDIVQKAGATGGAIMAALWWLERKERIRLQRILEGYLPILETTSRVIRGVSRAVGVEDDP